MPAARRLRRIRSLLCSIRPYCRERPVRKKPGTSREPDATQNGLACFYLGRVINRIASHERSKMRVTPFLRYQPFCPEQIEAMATAFDDACAALEITDRTDDPATEIVAGCIIELARRGVRNQTDLYQGAVKWLFNSYTA